MQVQIQNMEELAICYSVGLRVPKDILKRNMRGMLKCRACMHAGADGHQGGARGDGGQGPKLARRGGRRKGN